MFEGVLDRDLQIVVRLVRREVDDVELGVDVDHEAALVHDRQRGDATVQEVPQRFDQRRVLSDLKRSSP